MMLNTTQAHAETTKALSEGQTKVVLPFSFRQDAIAFTNDLIFFGADRKWTVTCHHQTVTIDFTGPRKHYRK